MVEVVLGEAAEVSVAEVDHTAVAVEATVAVVTLLVAAVTVEDIVAVVVLATALTKYATLTGVRLRSFWEMRVFWFDIREIKLS